MIEVEIWDPVEIRVGERRQSLAGTIRILDVDLVSWEDLSAVLADVVVEAVGQHEGRGASASLEDGALVIRYWPETRLCEVLAAAREVVGV